MWPIFDCYWNMPLFVYRIRDVILIIKDVAFSRKSALLLKLRTLIEMYANSFRFTQWNHLFYFLLQGIILILKCSRYFICSESIKKMSIFACYLVFVFFFFKRSMQIPIKIPAGSIQDKEIEYFTFSYIHGSWLFILCLHCGICNKKGTFRVFTGFGHLQTSETSGRNMTVEIDSRHPLLPKAGWGKWRFDWF